VIYLFIKFWLIFFGLYLYVSIFYRALLSKLNVAKILSYFFFLFFTIIYASLLTLRHGLNLSLKYIKVLLKLNYKALNFFLNLFSIVQSLFGVNVFFYFYRLSRLLMEFWGIDIVYSFLIIKEAVYVFFKSIFLISEPCFRYCIFFLKLTFYMKFHILDVWLYKVMFRFISNFKAKLASKAYLYKLGFFFYFFKLCNFIISRVVFFFKFFLWLQLEVALFLKSFYKFILMTYVKASRRFRFFFYFFIFLLEHVAYFIAKLRLFCLIKGYFEFIKKLKRAKKF